MSAKKRSEAFPLNATITTPEDLDKLDYLKANVDDWSTVEIYWKDTYDVRREQLTSGITITEYISNFACLQVEKAHTLVSTNILKY